MADRKQPLEDQDQFPMILTTPDKIEYALLGCAIILMVLLCGFVLVVVAL